jgi:hypothetical protein
MGYIPESNCLWAKDTSHPDVHFSVAEDKYPRVPCVDVVFVRSCAVVVEPVDIVEDVECGAGVEYCSIPQRVILGFGAVGTG